MDDRRWWGLRPWRRHSLVLMVGGLVYMGVGVAFLTADALTHRQKQTLVVAINLFPLTVWGIIFLLAGLLACLSARWPPFAETWGYMVLCGLSAGWSAAYLMGYCYGAPSAAVTNGLVWALMAFMWWAVSGLVNPVDKAIVAAVIADETN